MTEQDIMQWQAEMFVYSCILYEECDDPLWSDEMFDDHCRKLLKWYARLPAWFRDRVPTDNLSAGTAVGLHFTDDERAAAIEWRDRVRALKET